MPRKGAPAPIEADDRFDDSGRPRPTLASNGSRSSGTRALSERRGLHLGARFSRIATTRSIDVEPTVRAALHMYARGRVADELTRIWATSRCAPRHGGETAFAVARASRADAMRGSLWARPAPRPPPRWLLLWCLQHPTAWRWARERGCGALAGVVLAIRALRARGGKLELLLKQAKEPQRVASELLLFVSLWSRDLESFVDSQTVASP
jgi:hypothetical protein